MAKAKTTALPLHYVVISSLVVAFAPIIISLLISGGVPFFDFLSVHTSILITYAIIAGLLVVLYSLIKNTTLATNYPFLLAFALNVILIEFVLYYFLSPYFDFVVFNLSVEKLCLVSKDFTLKDNPGLTSFCKEMLR